MKKWNGYQKGVNLGGWLSQGDLTPEHCSTFITADDIAYIAKAGFDHLRLPIDYDLVQAADGSFIEEGFSYIDSCIKWCGDCGLNMVLDLHKTAGYSFDEGEKESGFFHSETYISRFIALWTELAKRYGQYESRLAFELLNEVVEPSDNEPWMKIAEKTVSVIRQYAPTIKILIGSYYNNSVSTVKHIAEPFDENIIYNFHCYDPLLFTHQRAYWVRNMPNDFYMSYPLSKADFLAQSATVPVELDDYRDLIPEEGFNPQYFENLFKSAIETAEARGVMLYCGEYGVIELADPQSAVKWYRDIHGVFEKYGIGRALWCYKGKDFGLTDGLLSCVKEDIIANA